MSHKHTYTYTYTGPGPGRVPGPSSSRLVHFLISGAVFVVSIESGSNNDAESKHQQWISVLAWPFRCHFTFSYQPEHINMYIIICTDTYRKIFRESTDSTRKSKKINKIHSQAFGAVGALRAPSPMDSVFFS